MKIRNGFVSNSSSASFVIKLNKLTEQQIEMIKNHRFWGKIYGVEYSDDEWSISINDETISGYTTMANFSITKFLDKIGVERKFLNYEDD